MYFNNGSSHFMRICKKNVIFVCDMYVTYKTDVTERSLGQNCTFSCPAMSIAVEFLC